MSAQFLRATCIVYLLFAFSLAGCLGGSSPEVTATGESDELAYTQAAQTIMAELTESAPTQASTSEQSQAAPEATQLSPTPTDEPLPPTSTLAPTSTPEPTNTPIPTLSPTPFMSPTPTEANFVLTYQDDFTTYRWWPTMDEGNVVMGYASRGYSILNNEKMSAVWSVRSDQFDNVRVEVTASRISGPWEGQYGVICRFGDHSHYYLLAVGSDGWYGIGKRVPGKLEYIEEGFDTASIIHTGDATNLIRADCVGTTLTLYANGQMLLQVMDTDYSAGSVGLTVGTRGTPGYGALFDDFSVFELQ